MTKEENFNALGPRQNGCHFTDDIFKCIFLIENIWIPIRISLKFVPKGPINNIPALWCIVIFSVYLTFETICASWKFY